jgi:hypothetical protein
MEGIIEIASSNAYYFSNALQNDFILSTTMNTQRVLIGASNGTTSAMAIAGANIFFDKALSVNTPSIIPSAPLTVNASLNAAPNSNAFAIYQASNVSTAHAVAFIGTAGTSSGNPYVSLNVAGQTCWTVGVENADARKFKVRPANDFASNVVPSITCDPSTGNVGIKTNNPSGIHQLFVAGSIYANGDVVAFSDSNYKTDLKIIDAALAKVDALHGYTFQRSDSDDAKRFAGLIAQEVEDVLPEVVYTDEKGIKSVAYGNVTALLVEAIKELKEQVATLSKRLDDLA